MKMCDQTGTYLSWDTKCRVRRIDERKKIENFNLGVLCFATFYAVLKGRDDFRPQTAILLKTWKNEI